MAVHIGLIVAIVIVSAIIFGFIAHYFYRKIERGGQAEINNLSAKLDAAIPLLNKLISENIPIENSYDPNHSTHEDKAYDETIDRKILGENYGNIEFHSIREPELL